MKKKLPIKILVVEDSRDFQVLYKDLLLGQSPSPFDYEIEMVGNGSDAIEVFTSFKPDLIILDVKLPGLSGIEVCKQIRKITHNRDYVGIIFVTADNSSQLIVKCMEIGADDFCSKSQTANELIARIKTVVRIKKMSDTLRASNERLKAANERLARITITDDLTKLYNMRYFKQRLEQEFIRTQRYNKNLSLIMMDLDKFKQVNDQYDHLLGSYVLAETGKIISDSIRSVDIGARFGGDEYVLMLPETTPEGAVAMAERIGQAIAETEFDNGVHQVRVTASIGVSTMGPGCSVKFNNSVEFMRDVDQLLYKAKEQGRARVVSHLSAPKPATPSADVS